MYHLASNSMSRRSTSFKRATHMAHSHFVNSQDPLDKRPVSFNIGEYYTRFEEVTDRVHGPRRQWKPFQHYKRWLDFHPSEKKALWSVVLGGFGTYLGSFEDPYACYMSDERNVFGQAGRCNIGLPDIYTPGIGDEIVPPPNDLADLKTSSLRAMSPNVKAELSLINSVYELKDFRSVPRFISRVKQTMKRLTNHRAYKLVDGKDRFKTFHDLALVADDAFLQKEFNIDPLLSDIASLYKAMSRLGRRLKSFKSSSGRITTSHFCWRDGVEPRVELLSQRFQGRDGYHTSGAEGRLWDGTVNELMGSVTDTRRVTTYPAEFRAHMQFIPVYSADQIEHSQLYSFLDSLGVNLNPAIIWNAIPWSFVIDWVVGVSRWLDKCKVGFADPKVNILQYCWSYKVRRKIDLSSLVATWAPYQPAELVRISNIERPTIYEEAYRRSIDMPDASSLSTSGISSQEYILGGALAFTKTKRHRTRR